MGELTQGRFGVDAGFVSLLLKAIRAGFTGLLNVSTAGGNVMVYFCRGWPAHVSGPGASAHRLGQLLVDRSLCSRAEVEAALAEQQRAKGRRALLGSILARDGLDAEQIDRCIRFQIRARLGALAHVREGEWYAYTGENGNAREFAVPIDPWTILLELMESEPARRALLSEPDDLCGQDPPERSLPERKRRQVQKRVRTRISLVNAVPTYDAAIGGMWMYIETMDSEQRTMARSHYGMGVVCLRTKDFARAREALTEAVDNDPSSGTYLATLAWATYADPSRRRNAAYATCRCLTEAIDKDPDSLAAHEFMAKLQEDMGLLHIAYFHYDQVLRLDPRHDGALNAKRRLARRLKK